MSGKRHLHFCGAYWFYGFHEDGLNSAIRVAERLGVGW
jgi:predicted NAD/FAD-binding protein